MYRRIVSFVFLIAVLVLLPGTGRARTVVDALRVGIHSEGVTRVVLGVSDSMLFRTRLLAAPDRVVIDTPPLAWETPPFLSRAVGSVARLGYRHFGDNGRVVLYLRRPAIVRQAFMLSPRGGDGWRFVVDLENVSRQTFTAAGAGSENGRMEGVGGEGGPGTIVLSSPRVAARPSFLSHRGGGPVLSEPMPPPPRPRPMAVTRVAATLAVPPPPPPPPRPPLLQAAMPVPVPHPTPRPRHLRPMVVIDPGHGGIDPGTTGIGGIHEKVITLAAAKELRRLLLRTGRYRVRMTRTGDYYVSLSQRVALARHYGADLFISLHANEIDDPSIHGLSVYTLSNHASDAVARAAANSENRADRLDRSDVISGVDLTHQSTDVAHILIDLARRATMNQSDAFAQDIVNQLGRTVPLLQRTHRSADFAVLKALDVPSVLIEMGYLSNPTEEHHLCEPSYRRKLDSAIVRAINMFFDKSGDQARS